MNWFWRAAATGLAALLLLGCATPSDAIVDRIRELKFSVSTVTGTRYRHLVARAGQADDRGAIHIYVDHDGLPWERPDVISSDPTPRYPLALEMMARDGGNRLYLGRPCYFGFGDDPGCNARLWTDARYSDEVVQSLAAVVNQIVESSGTTAVVLIGYSGGGTIAWLMSQRVPATTAVVTVAANLDVKAWTTLHGFTPLFGSLDPGKQAPLPPSIRQVHMVGGRDSNVPPAITRSVALRQTEARVVEIPEFDHVCCWLQRWPGLMRSAVTDIPK
jgi:dienelactone hydrolase